MISAHKFGENINFYSITNIIVYLEIQENLQTIRKKIIQKDCWLQDQYTDNIPRNHQLGKTF